MKSSRSKLVSARRSTELSLLLQLDFSAQTIQFIYINSDYISMQTKFGYENKCWTKLSTLNVGVRVY